MNFFKATRQATTYSVEQGKSVPVTENALVARASTNTFIDQWGNTYNTEEATKTFTSVRNDDGKVEYLSNEDSKLVAKYAKKSMAKNWSTQVKYDDAGSQVPAHINQLLDF